MSWTKSVTRYLNPKPPTTVEVDNPLIADYYNNVAFLEGDTSRNFVSTVTYTYSSPKEGPLARCKGCGSSDFKMNRCLWCRRMEGS